MKMVANLKPRPKQQELPDHEELLLDYAVRLPKHLSGRRAVHLHFSKLQLANRRGQNLRNAAGFFKTLIRVCEGQQFILMNQDMVVILKGASVAQIDEVVLKLRYLLSDDPLARDDSENNGIEFCTW